MSNANIHSDETIQGCTGALVTGSTSAKGNMVGETTDFGRPFGENYKLELVIPEKGNRYLRGVLNEKGVGLTQYFRGARTIPYEGTDKLQRVTKDELLGQADSAREYMELWAENVTRYGIDEPKGAQAQLIVDPKEGYLLEAANYVYGNADNHAILGPMKDQVFAHANFFVSKRLKQVEIGIGAGYNRAKRMWELLVERQYDSITGPNPGISLAYLMNCFRDHGDLSPEEGRMSSYVPEERGKKTICVHSMLKYSARAHICLVTAEHTEFFSCLWTTFGQPCLCPFLPCYISINTVPEAMRTNTAARTFERLHQSLEYHPEYRAEITSYWKMFDIQSIEESSLLETEAVTLLGTGKQDEARKRLTDFVENRCNQALSTASQILNDLESLPRIKKPN
jgi:dipeptidase